MIFGFAKTSGRRIANHVIDTSTCRGAAFFHSPKFREAKARAIAQGADMVVADIQELLRRTPERKILACVTELDDPHVEIYDALLGRSWSSLPIRNREEMLVNSTRERLARSRAVKAGHLLGKKERRAPRTNALNGSRANKLKADKAAIRLAEFVRNEERQLAPSASLSPSALARALNEADISSSRGGKWTHNAAKNLIARLKRLK
jgi:hypothetical protein